MVKSCVLKLTAAIVEAHNDVSLPQVSLHILNVAAAAVLGTLEEQQKMIHVGGIGAVNLDTFGDGHMLYADHGATQWPADALVLDEGIVWAPRWAGRWRE